MAWATPLARRRLADMPPAKDGLQIGIGLRIRLRSEGHPLHLAIRHHSDLHHQAIRWRAFVDHLVFHVNMETIARFNIRQQPFTKAVLDELGIMLPGSRHRFRPAEI